MGWENLNHKVRDFAIRHSVDKAEEPKAKRKKFEGKKLELLILSTPEETLIQEYLQHKHHLDEIYN